MDRWVDGWINDLSCALRERERLKTEDGDSKQQRKEMNGLQWQRVLPSLSA